MLQNAQPECFVAKITFCSGFLTVCYHFCYLFSLFETAVLPCGSISVTKKTPCIEDVSVPKDLSPMLLQRKSYNTVIVTVIDITQLKRGVYVAMTVLILKRLQYLLYQKIYRVIGLFLKRQILLHQHIFVTKHSGRSFCD